MTFKDFIYYMYYRIYCFGVLISDDPLNNMKPSFVFGLLYLFSIMQIYSWYCLYTNTKTYVSHPIIAIIVFSISYLLLDYFIFSENQKWKLKSKKFEHFSSPKKILFDIITMLVILIIIGSLILSMSKIDKAGLRRR